MRRQCPNCKSLNVRRSSREEGDAEQPFYRSPYRCRDCRTKFWAFSTKIFRRIVVASVLTSIVVALLIVLAITVGLGGPRFG